MKVKITEILRKIWLLSANNIENSESFRKQHIYALFSIIFFTVITQSSFGFRIGVQMMVIGKIVGKTMEIQMMLLIWMMIWTTNFRLQQLIYLTSLPAFCSHLSWFPEMNTMMMILLLRLVELEGLLFWPKNQHAQRKLF